MSGSLQFIYDSKSALTCEDDNHYHLKVFTYYEIESTHGRRIDFIFDTGAFITVLTRQTAIDMGFGDDAYTIETNFKLNGISGFCLADIKEIPGFLIGISRLSGVKVAVPQTVDFKYNILGLNVIEHFKYCIDTEKDEIFFAQNPDPAISTKFLSKSIFSVSNDKA